MEFGVLTLQRGEVEDVELVVALSGREVMGCESGGGVEGGASKYDGDRDGMDATTRSGS